MVEEDFIHDVTEETNEVGWCVTGGHVATPYESMMTLS